ncbi:MAG: PTS sugar transporter subunit IIB [Lachnospiraceae bacterium]|jgi:PTS system mannose-specific IIB component|nr:PTS sugar transporter subunit IIB [Lachnospiraceae bacterium]
MAKMHARVDERLIHGQVAAMWTGLLGITRIVVVNDEAVRDEMLIAALKIARPAGIKLSILSRNKAVEKLKGDAYPGETLFVITKNIADMKHLIDQGVEIRKVNLGNLAKREGTTELKRSVYVTEQDVVDIKALLDQGIAMTAQMVPTDSDRSVAEYLS